MANQTQASQIYSQINQLINSSRFGEAFIMLKNRINRFPTLNKELQKLQASESTYRYLVDYIISGFHDSGRDDMIEQIRDTLLRANDLLLREEKQTDSSDLYYSTRRLETMRQNSFKYHLDNFLHVFEEDNPEKTSPESLKISRLQTSRINDIFNYVWTMSGADASEYENLADALNDPVLPEYLKLSLISAIILGSTEFFDAYFFDILLTQYEKAESLKIKAKAITGVLLISLLYPGRLKGNINLRSRLMLTVNDPEIQKIIRDVLLSIIRTYDTQRIDNKMRNEVLPGLMKISPDIIDKMRNLASDSENFLSDANPDWEEMLEESGVKDRLQEINDLQLEGADVMVTAFSQLKSYPFFDKVFAWFFPFMPGNEEFASLSLKQDNDFIDHLTTVMCDSDLHSFLLSINVMPKEKASQMIKNLEWQITQAKEAMTNSIGETEVDLLSKRIRQSLQDLYRFFKFFKKKGEFKDPFAEPFTSIHLKPLISTLGITPEDLRLVGEFYFKKNYFEEAAGVFKLYDSLQPDDLSVWQKIGYSFDRIRNFPEAVEWYKKAELIDPENDWLTKKLAVALKNSGNSGDALEYYSKALENEPENYHLLISAAQCYLDLNQPDKALQYFYHAHYLKPEKLSPLRGIAWAELLSGNFDKADSLYEKLTISEKSDKNDFLNAGHCSLARGDFKKAVDYYKSFIEISESPEIKSLVLAFRDDNEAMKKLHIKTEDMRLIIDKIRYDSLS